MVDFQSYDVVKEHILFKRAHDVNYRPVSAFNYSASRRANPSHFETLNKRNYVSHKGRVNEKIKHIPYP